MRGDKYNTNKKTPFIVYVAKCILDPYTRSRRASRLLDIGKLIALLHSLEIGIYSYDCPGLLFYGLAREGEYDTLEYREFCRTLAEKLVEELIMMLKMGYSIVGIIGIDPSPTCAVEEKAIGKDESGRNIYGKGQGIFIEELAKSVQKHKLRIPLMSWTPYSPKTDIQYKRIRETLIAQIQQ